MILNHTSHIHIHTYTHTHKCSCKMHAGHPSALPFLHLSLLYLHSYLHAPLSFLGRGSRAIRCQRRPRPRGEMGWRVSETTSLLQEGDKDAQALLVVVVVVTVAAAVAEVAEVSKAGLVLVEEEAAVIATSREA